MISKCKYAQMIKVLYMAENIKYNVNDKEFSPLFNKHNVSTKMVFGRGWR